MADLCDGGLLRWRAFVMADFCDGGTLRWWTGIYPLTHVELLFIRSSSPSTYDDSLSNDSASID